MIDQVVHKAWQLVKIADVSNKGQQRKPNSDESFTYVDIGSIDRNSKRISTPQRLKGEDAPSRARKIINAGDVLVSLTRPNLNAVALVTKEYDEQIASTGFEVIKPVSVESRYIFALTRTKDFIDAISGVTQGALYPAAKSADVQAYTFLLPPLAEQTVIADKLDTLLEQVATTKTRLERSLETLKQFRQSVLEMAMKGHFINRKEPALKRINELVSEPLKNGKSVKDGDGPRVLRLTALKNHVVDLEEFKNGMWTTDLASKFFVQEGDILVSRGNGSLNLLARGSVVKNVRKDTAYPDTMIRIRLDKNKISSSFFLLAWSSLVVREQIQSSAKTTAGIWKVSQKDLSTISVPYFSISEQAEIVRRVEKLFAGADATEQQVNQALARVNNLTQSILAKAFRGELTEQWRKDNLELISGDNSVEVLLEKIKAERAITKPTRNTRKKA